MNLKQALEIAEKHRKFRIENPDTYAGECDVVVCLADEVRRLRKENIELQTHYDKVDSKLNKAENILKDIIISAQSRTYDYGRYGGLLTSKAHSAGYDNGVIFQGNKAEEYFKENP